MLLGTNGWKIDATEITAGLLTPQVRFRILHLWLSSNPDHQLVMPLVLI